MKVRAPCLLLLLAGCAHVAPIPEPSVAEVAMKTEALVNLPRYVEWPSSAFVEPTTPLMLGVYGDSKIHKALADAIHGKVLNGRTVIVRRFHWPQQPNSHLLFIASSERRRLPWILKKTECSTTLTVAEFDDFLAEAGMVRMSIKDDKLRFHVNTTVAREAGLKFSSKFLGVADQVVGER